MNRPLTKKERVSFEATQFNEEFTPISSIIECLLAAEAYWREAVRDASGDPQDGCAFCGNSRIESHDPDCPWKLAQDAECIHKYDDSDSDCCLNCGQDRMEA